MARSPSARGLQEGAGRDGGRVAGEGRSSGGRSGRRARARCCRGLAQLMRGTPVAWREGGQAVRSRARERGVGAEQQVGAGVEQLTLASARASEPSRRAARGGAPGRGRTAPGAGSGRRACRRSRSSGGRAGRSGWPAPSRRMARSMRRRAPGGVRARARRGEAERRRSARPSFPVGVGRVGQVLQRAAAAGAEMRAGRGDAVGRGLEDRRLSAPKPSPRLTSGPGLHELARQRAGQEQRLAVRSARDAVAVGADPLDADAGR